MNFKEIYTVEFTEDAKEEITEIYEYISKNLKAEKSAKRIMKEIKDKILTLANFPEKYTKIERTSKIKKEFRRMLIGNFVVLYTIEQKYKKIYISHMYYSRRNYL